MKRINLIPDESKRITPEKWLKGYFVKSSMAQAVAVAVILFIALNVWQATTLIRYKIAIINHKRSINALQSRIGDAQASYQKMLSERGEIERESSRIEEKLKVLSGAEGGKLTWAKTLSRLSKLVPEDMWINKGAFNKDAISIVGTTFDNSIVSAFMAKLDGSGYLKDTTFTYTQKAALEEKPVLDFEVVTHIISEKALRN